MEDSLSLSSSFLFCTLLRIDSFLLIRDLRALLLLTSAGRNLGSKRVMVEPD